jgi:hypothetical protein
LNSFWKSGKGNKAHRQKVQAGHNVCLQQRYWKVREPHIRKQVRELPRHRNGGKTGIQGGPSRLPINVGDHSLSQKKEKKKS